MKRRAPVRLSMLSVAAMLRALVDGPCSNAELAEVTGMHYRTMQRYTHALHRAKLLHIDHWEQDGRGRHVIRVYVFGEGKDAKRPKKDRAKLSRAKRRRDDLRTLIHITAGALTAPESQEHEMA
jgi:DNA-binding IclR family transcriptional regulator